MLELLQAALTPLIGVITAYVAYQQYRLRRDERSLLMYDRRLAIFKSAIAAVDKVRAGGDMKPEDALAWATSVAEAQFLFGEEVPHLLDEVFARLYEYAIESEAQGDSRIPLAEAMLTVEYVRTPLQRVFTPYLRPADSPNSRLKRLSIKEVQALLPPIGKDGRSPDDDIPF